MVQSPPGSTDFKRFIGYVEEHQSLPDTSSYNGNLGIFHDRVFELIEMFQEYGYDGFKNSLEVLVRNDRDVMSVLSSPSEEDEESKYLQFLEFGDLKNLPAPEWLVYRFLPTKGVNFIYGPAGEGKTYLSVGLSVAIASEEMDSWLGLAIRHGHVVYVAAEDIDEVAQRFIGCAHHYNLDDIPNLHIFPASLQLVQDTSKLIESIKHRYGDIKVAAFVFDTLAMCSLGIEENSKKDFDAVTRSLEAIWREFNCCVAAIHHSGRNGEIRGTSSMDGVAYSMIKVSKVDERVQVHSTKSRRGKGFEDFYLEWTTVDVAGVLDEMGEQATTGVLIRSDKGDGADPTKLSKMQREILQHAKNLGGIRVPRIDVMKACQIDRNHEPGFCNATSVLLQKGLLTMELEKRRTFYTLTDFAKELLQNDEL